MKAKGFINIEGVKYPVFDLVGKYSNNEHISSEIEKFKAENKFIVVPVNITGDLKAGDVVKIISGENKDLIYEVEILGFHHSTGEAYFVWDCYWVRKDLNKCMVK